MAAHTEGGVMPVIPILLSDTAAAVDYKINLVGQVSAIEDENEALKLRRRYYAGDHDLLLTDDQVAFFDNIISKAGKYPIDNKIAVVVNKLRRRINVQGFAMPDEQAVTSETAAAVSLSAHSAAEWAWRWWADNKMDAAERDLYQAALVDGYGFVSVEPAADGNPVFHVQKRWDGESGIRFFWEQDSVQRNPAYAVKYWYTRDPLNLDANNLLRITLYTKDRIYKWIRLTNAAKQAKYFNLLEREGDDPNLYRILDAGETSYPIEWTDKQGKALGLPVVPFVAPMGNLVDGVIGLQDALNKTWVDIIALGDQQGFGQIVVQYPGSLPTNTQTATGAVNTASTTGDDGLGMRPGRILELGGGANAQKLPADDLTGLHNTVKLIVTAIASNIEQPLYHFIPLSGEVPSGAALDELSKPVAEQAEEVTVTFTDSWREVMSLAQRISATFGGGYTGEAVMLTPRWMPQPKSPETEANAYNPAVQLVNAIGTLTGLGISVEGAARFLGVGEDRIKLLADSGLLPPPEQ